MKALILSMLCKLKPEQEFENCENFIDEGILDSFDIIELISMLEDEFGIVIDGMDVLPENFSNIDCIENLVRKSGDKM